MKSLLIPDWRSVLLTAWTIRVAVFWICVWSLISIWLAFINVLPLWVWAPIGFVMSFSFGLARLLKQPGTDDA
jgi:hypothetical protein